MSKTADQRKTKKELLTEINQLRQQLKMSDQSHQHISSVNSDFLDLCQMGSWRIDFPSEKFTCSPELLDILQSGNGNGQPSFKDFTNSLNSEDQTIFSENLENLKKSKKSFKQIASLNRNNNSYKPIIMRVEYIKTRGSQFSLYASIMDAVKLESSNPFLK